MECRRVDIAVSSSMMDVLDFALGRVSAYVAGASFISGALRRTAEASEL